MTEITFETAAERSQREQQEAAEREALAASRQRDAINAQANAEAAKAHAAAFEVAHAKEEEESLASQGRTRLAELAEARSRAERLRYEVEQQAELAQINAEIRDREIPLAWEPLMKAPHGEVARINHLRTLATLWPLRLAYMRERLAAAEQQVKELETSLDKIKRQFTEAAEKAKAMLRGAQAAAGNSLRGK